MRVLVIAYDFPPIPSPQSLRWAYLVRELACLGHKVHVLVPALPGYGPGGLPELPESVVVHRVFPGPLSALLARGERRRAATRASAACAVHEEVAPPANTYAPEQLNWKGRLRRRIEDAPRRALAGLGISSSRLNWKGLLAEGLKSAASFALFPDYRAEWIPGAKRALRRILIDLDPDVVVTSHEPACSLPLGLESKRLGRVWVADLGDPVLAPYTAPRWRSRAFALERDVCRQADLVTVTTSAAGALLQDRHGLPVERCMVLTQGFDATFSSQSSVGSIAFEPDRLELLYTGSFYSFRRAEALVSAVIRTAGARLTVCTVSPPDYLTQAAALHPDKFRLAGFLPHRDALALQRLCDVTVNLANADPVQVPGKIYEYLGSGRPVLHLREKALDATSALVESMGAGWHLEADAGLMADFLAELRALKARRGLLTATARDAAGIQQFSWQSLAGAWSERVQAMCLSKAASGLEP